MGGADQESGYERSVGGADRKNGFKRHRKNILRINEKPNANDAWLYTNNDQIDLVRRSGLYPLNIVSMNRHNCGTLSTIIERLHVETNTGHFNVDIVEMMPTLEDRWKVLRLKATGVVVIVRRVENYEEHIVRMIGQLPSGHSHSFIRLTWLRNRFRQIPQNYNRTTLLRYTGAYLFYLVRCTIFADFTDGTVPIIYLQFFEDINVAGQYAWSAATLSFLFRALSKVVHDDHQHLSTPAIILLYWVYEHFKLLCPIPKEIKAG
ncbi:protein MAIN-LIKE 2 [Amborella trichopoda]|uniref:protein MAIN-LIKE 2 n=1 Tax=Amborella trichopoda TaxID=13333 RepID=UPI0005D37D40|nr:protein MAIN-LIKE 2 [Amborella trichopoda]|eukprot:XP_011625493.1 protein MAIN-LIKE 2 [Amborella trichopoda]